MKTHTSVPWYRSIRTQWVVTAIAVELLMLSILTANSYRLVSNALESQTFSRMEALTPLLNASLAGRVFQRDHSEIHAIIEQLIASELTEIRYIVVYDSHQAVLAQAGAIDQQQMPILDQNIQNALHDMTYHTGLQLKLYGAVIGSVRFGLSLSSMDSLRSRVLQQSILIAAIEVLLSLLLLASGGYLITQHITTLLEATRQVARGNYRTPVTINRRDEIGQLADTFNQMAATVQNRIEALAESESRFRAIFNAVGDAIFIHDAKSGQLIDVNQRMCDRYRCTREQALQMQISDFTAVREEYSPQLAQEMMQLACTQGSCTFEWMARTYDNLEDFWVEVHLRYAYIGQDARIIAVVRDISERKQAETEQRLAATSFETINSILITDRHGTILRVNRAFCEMTGYSAREVVGQNPRLLHSGRQDSAFYREMWQILHDKGQWRGEIWNRRKNGEIYPEWLSISTVRDHHGQITHYVGSSTDLSELKNQQRENELRAEEERVLGELLRLSLQPLAIQEYLEQALQSLLCSVPWLNVARKGGIFLVDESDQHRLNLLATYNLSDQQQALCTQIPFNHCLCGRAAATQQLQFSTDIDHRHTITYAGMQPHGHYNVPIMVENRLLGVMVLYLSAQHAYSDSEAAFLQRVADVLGMGICRRQIEAEIEYQAYHDNLTHLPNRRLLMERLHQELALAQRLNLYGALLFIDLDHFKKVNDMLGHSSGDLLLNQVSDRLTRHLRSGDTAARLGGDEFVVLLQALGNTPEEAALQARTLATTINRELELVYDIKGHSVLCTASIGIVLFPDSCPNNPADLLRFADTAMFSAKRDGRNAVHFYQPEMQAAVEERLTLELELRHALETDQFILHYQPQIEIASGRIMGVEALVRWLHPEKGLISPAKFIPIADETNQIIALGEWVLNQAIAQLKEWLPNDRLPHDFTLSVNVSPRQFRKADFNDQVKRILTHHGVDPKHLKLEITEGVVIENLQDTITKMEDLQAFGVRFSMDDFGTGYSSLSYLKRLPLYQLKIDQSFVRDMLQNPSDATIITTIIHMARDLKLEVIAEGVETPEELDFLRQRNCFAYQGYLFSRPVPAEQIVVLFDSH